MTTAAAIRHQVLEPVLDAQACNAHQTRLIVNPTPEPDSIVEHFAAAARHCDPTGRAHLSAAITLLNELLASNQAEGGLERQIAGTADIMVRDAQRAEHAAQPAQPWSIKRVARTLRGPLADLCNPIITGANRDQALANVHQVFRDAPTTALLCVAVRHELGVRKYSKLIELHSDWTVRGRK